MALTGTYRLQLHHEFTFVDAQAVVPYIAELGASHLYLSPILQAASGSLHGYDVIDHSAIAHGLGGLSGFEALVDTARQHGLGIVVDIVPNHMAFVAPEYVNRPLWQVLREGRGAATASWFDIDWEAGHGRLGIPVLACPLDRVIADGDLHLGLHEAEPVLRYHEHVFPLAPGTAPAGLTAGDTRLTPAGWAQLLGQQHYLLADWRTKDEVLTYRRFFEVDRLIAVRVEEPAVFEQTHALLLDLHHRGLIDGFRIDHPDGLTDPLAYLRRLRAALRPGTPLWVEKILIGDEPLPADWPTAGSTGYDALRAITAALVDVTPDAVDVVHRTWLDAGGEPSLSVTERTCKRLVLAESFQPESARLARAASEARPDLEPGRVREATVELLAAAEVYRAYVRPGQPIPEESRRLLRRAHHEALAERPELGAELDALLALALTEPLPQGPAHEAADARAADAAALDFAIRLQQTWGPVMAKGIEDTTFYRFHRLVALNEVGGDPDLLSTQPLPILHAWAARQQAHWPQGLVALSTHDTKRSEDVRARLLAVAGDPVAWRECAQVAARAADAAGVDAVAAHLVWQTLLGVLPIEAGRLREYLVKALREGKERTSWRAPEQDYERAVVEFAESHRVDGPLHEAVTTALNVHQDTIASLTLAQKALQLTLPGVPDIYQGCELLERSLVDPDNRRPVDFAERARLLAESAEPLPSAASEGADGSGCHDPASALSRRKLLLVHRLLTLRRDHPAVFGDRSSYTPLATDVEHLVAFARGRAERPEVVVAATRAPVALARRGGWGADTVELPSGPWRDVLTDLPVEGGVRGCAELLAHGPVAVLVRSDLPQGGRDGR